MNIHLTKPQSDLIRKTCPYPLFVAGYGSGKSFVLIASALRDLFENPGANIGIYSPTYDLNRLNLEPRFIDALDEAGARYMYNKSTAVISVRGYGDVIFRSMDNPLKIVAYEVFRSHCDEIDTLPRQKAEAVWNKIIARNRQTVMVDGTRQPNRVTAYSTPEGFGFTYHRWAKGGEGYEYVTAPTYSNPHIPEDYIDNLRATYPGQLVDAYIEGKWVNLTSGVVYTEYDRVKCRSAETIRADDDLYIGCDFNVGKQAACVYVKRGIIWHLVDELVDMLDTPEMIRIIKSKWPGRRVYIYPDASGGSRKTVDASISDIALLGQAGFYVRAKKSNPAVRDRIMAANAAFNSGVVLVNDTLAPESAACLEQQIYKNGEPDKSAGVDHQNDAATYPIAYELPIVKPLSSVKVNFVM